MNGFFIVSLHKLKHYNNMKVVSLFSGCGGSSCGYYLAGMKPVLAVEFIKEAYETYEKNFKGAHVIKRDVRTITGKEILDIIGMKVGELDVLDGSPPCASFSVNGNRDKDWGKLKKYSSTTQRTDDLFDEYIRMVDEIKPKRFVAENVKGMCMGNAMTYLESVIERLEKLGYLVEWRVLNSADYGVPQKRERVIIRGVRKDVGDEIIWAEKNDKQVTTKEAIGHLIDVESDSKMNEDAKRVQMMRKYFRPLCSASDVRRISTENGLKVYQQTYRRDKWDAPYYTIKQHHTRPFHPIKDRYMSSEEAKILMSFPDWFKFVEGHSSKQNWERMGRAVPPLMMKSVAESIKKEALKTPIKLCQYLISIK